MCALRTRYFADHCFFVDIQYVYLGFMSHIQAPSSFINAREIPSAFAIHNWNLLEQAISARISEQEQRETNPTKDYCEQLISSSRHFQLLNYLLRLEAQDSSIGFRPSNFLRIAE